jgi:hypothetical protein
MEAEPVDERSKGWLKGCSIGCGGLALVSILGLVVVSVRTLVPLRSASRARAQLEARFGPPESFVPAADGAIPAERIQHFLDVRGSLDEPCARFRSAQLKMRRVETLEGEEKGRLDAAFCPATAGIEMDRDSGRAMIIALY